MAEEKYCGPCGLTQPHETVGGKLTCMVCGAEPQAEPSPAVKPGKKPKAEEKQKMTGKLTETDKADIVRLVAAGKAIAVLAEDFHVSGQTIRNVVKAAKKSGKGAAPKKGAPKPEAAAKERVAGQGEGLRGVIERAAGAAAEAAVKELRSELPELVRGIIQGELAK